MAIVVKLDDMLHERRMTLTELAERVDITLANLSILKTGKARAMRFSTLEAICTALDCQPGDILEFRPDPGAATQTIGRLAHGFDCCLHLATCRKTRPRGLTVPAVRPSRDVFVLVVGLGAMIVPELLSHELTSRGVIASLLGAVWVLAFLGLRYPLQMLPLLMFEFVWKAIWMIAYGLPQWSADQYPPTFAEDFFNIAFGAILLLVDPVGLCLAPLCEAARRPLALSSTTEDLIDQRADVGEVRRSRFRLRH